MIVEIQLYNDLEISGDRDFLDHIKYISDKLVSSIIDCYLKRIIGENYENVFMSKKDYLSILTMYYYPKEFLISDDEYRSIVFIVEKFMYLNKNSNEIESLSEWYNLNISELVSNIKNILKNILTINRESVCDNYSKIYYNLKNLEADLDDEKIKKDIGGLKDGYYQNLKDILGDMVDDYLKGKESKLENDKEYDNFRSVLFMDQLKKDLNSEPPKWNSVIYLLDIIRKKLCFISPVAEKYNSIKDNINNMLDIKYLRQLIENGLFNNDNLINIFNFIVEKINEFQAKSDKEEFNKWVNEIKSEYLEKIGTISINNILPDLLSKILAKLDKLESTVYHYRQKLYEEFKEDP